MNISGEKMLCHIKRVAGDFRPITADIFLTNFCNNHCPYCTYRRWKLDNGARAMGFNDFVRYANRLRDFGVLGFILTGGGEPTLCPDFMKITKWLESEKIHYGINTNFNNIMYFKPDYIKVSLDGYDEESYERARGIRRYELVKRNIEDYAAWRRVYSPNTSLGIQWVASSVDEVFKFYNANQCLDVDYISFRPFESTNGKYYSTEEKRAQAREISAAIEQLASNDERVIRNFKWDLLDRQEDDCTANWAQIAINEVGEVMYCCHKPYQIIGHIMDDDILEKKEKTRTDMRMCDIPCRMTAPNMFASKVKEKRKDEYFI